uniref:Seipin n=1 Tax=Plectus sambesii TaxID=2011161 RepID=A0A914XEB8_9BILA
MKLLRWLVTLAPVEGTVKNVCLLASNVVFVVGSALIFALLVRHWWLPTVSSLHTQLNFLFDTCQQDLGGICSFPTANISLVTAYGERVFTPGTAYSIVVDLTLVDCLENKHVGLFLTTLRLFGDRGNQLVAFARSSMFRHRAGIFQTLRRFVFLPFYLIGWTNEVEPLRLEFASQYYEKPGDPAVTLLVELQNKVLVVESAELSIEAQFGFVQSFLHYWPLTSAFFLFITVLACLGGVSMLYWTQKSAVYVFHRLEERASVRKVRREEAAAVERGRNELVKEELPECPSVSSIPGWDVTPNEIRRRHAGKDRRKGERST